VDEHVAHCSRCREELEALIPLRSYLARLAADELEGAGAPPPALRTRLRSAVRAERRRVVRRRVAAVAAIAAAVAVALLFAWPRGGEDPPAVAARSAAADAQTGVRATVAATSRAWGTELRVRMSGAAPGERCRLVARARDGRTEIAATWWTTYGGSAEVTGAAAIPAAELAALDVVTVQGRRLVHVRMAP
jgi:predicted anti-sigma-YlaC factor YlaD